MTSARNAREEAREVAGPGYDPRVLEPSPPAVGEPPWYADDPLAAGEREPGLLLLSPLPDADVTWAAFVAVRQEWAEWAAQRWLGAYKPLHPVPAGFAETRLALHRLTVAVLSPARQRGASGKMALRWTLGGFGTPFFGAGRQVRVQDGRLVVQDGDEAVDEPFTTLGAAAKLALGTAPDWEWAAELDVPEALPDDARLDVDLAAAAFLGDWFGFAWSVLEELRADAASTDASRVQLWAEHFDAAFEALPEGEQRRAGFGASPGDAANPDPYLYVVPWSFDTVTPSERWNAESFRGAILPYAELLAAPDQRFAALDFLRGARDELAGGR